MRIASIIYKGEQTYGHICDGHVCIPDDAFIAKYPRLTDVLAAQAYGQLSTASVQGRVAVDEAEFDALIPQPGKLICVGINYQAHMREMGRELPDYPCLFVRFPASQVGHDQPLIAPDNSEQYDFEGELALVIGREAHHVSAAEALDYVAGYTCFMDGSVRDFQRHESQFTPGKNFPDSGSFGPWLVTTDEISDPSALHLETRLNGQVMQQAPINDMNFGVPEIIEYCSSFARLMPGDVISTGTPSGVGFARQPPVWLKPGDLLEVEIDGIGVLRNPIVVAR